MLHVQVRGGQLWGTDIYTDDSDLVAGMWLYKEESRAYTAFVDTITEWYAVAYINGTFFCLSVLMHTGYCRPTASPPPPAIQELRATIRVLPPQDCKFVLN